MPLSICFLVVSWYQLEQHTISGSQLQTASQLLGFILIIKFVSEAVRMDGFCFIVNLELLIDIVGL